MSKVTERVLELALPVAEKCGCEIWDVDTSARLGPGICACISTSRAAYL